MSRLAHPLKPLEKPLILDIVGCIVEQLAKFGSRSAITASLIHPKYSKLALDILYDEGLIAKVSKKDHIRSIMDKMKARKVPFKFNILRIDTGAEKQRVNAEQLFAIECFEVILGADVQFEIIYLELIEFDWFIYDGLNDWPDAIVKAVKYVLDRTWSLTVLQDTNIDLNLVSQNSELPDISTIVLQDPAIDAFNSLAHFDWLDEIYCFVTRGRQDDDEDVQERCFHYGNDLDFPNLPPLLAGSIFFILIDPEPQSKISLRRDKGLEKRWIKNWEEAEGDKCEMIVNFLRYTYTKDLDKFQRLARARWMIICAAVEKDPNYPDTSDSEDDPDDDDIDEDYDHDDDDGDDNEDGSDDQEEAQASTSTPKRQRLQ